MLTSSRFFISLQMSCNLTSPSGQKEKFMPSEKPKGPSKAGVVVAALSALLCVVLVLAPIPAWVGIVAVIIWLWLAAPAIMVMGGLEFFDPTGVDLGTGFVGFLWWAGLYWVTASHYGFLAWWLGAAVAVLTAIVIGKVARHWTGIVMFLLGLPLGWGILWLNWIALRLGSPMANPVIGRYGEATQFGFVLLTALLVLAITNLASCAYCGTKLESYENKPKPGN